MKIHHLIIGIIITSMIVLGITTYVTDLGSSYGETADFTGLDNIKKKANETSVDMYNIAGNITSFQLEGPIDVILIPYTMIKIAWRSARVFFNSWNVVGAIISDLETTLANSGVILPSWLIPSIIAIIVATLIAIVIYGFFKWKFSD